MSHPTSPEQRYLSAPIGEQISDHLARRTAVRHATPLLPRNWAELLAPWRKAAARGEPAGARGNRPRLPSQAR